METRDALLKADMVSSIATVRKPLCPHAMAIFPICSPSNTPPREVICNDDQDVIQRAASNRGGGDGTDDVAKPVSDQ
jgi:hypothetical protein